MNISSISQFNFQPKFTAKREQPSKNASKESMDIAWDVYESNALNKSREQDLECNKSNKGEPMDITWDEYKSKRGDVDEN